jgi:cytochrome c oxidase cbb3-type subunit 1
MSVPANQSIPLEAPEESCRLPVLYLLGSGLCWLLAGLALALAASLKLHTPDFLPFAWAGVGRLEAAARNALLLGSASQTGLGVALWLLAKLGRTELVCGGTVFVATILWNIALTFGMAALLLGHTTGHPGLELPGSLGVVILVSYVLIAGVGIATFARCQADTYTLSQWFILAALLWFGWLYTTALVTTVCFPGRGVLTALSAGWFTQGFNWLWLTPLALAALYHFIPELSGRSLRSPELAPLAFWSLALFGGWTAASGLVGGPVPAWIVSVGVAAGVLLLIPVVLASLNLHVCGSLRTPAARFAALSATSFTIAGLAQAATSLRCSNTILHFTQFESALRELSLFGFVAGALFTGAYVIVPRLAGRNLPNAGLANAHFGLTVLGLVVLVGANAVGGWKQGWLLNDPKTDFATVQATLAPWLKLHTAGLALFVLGQVAFKANVVLLGIGLLKPVTKSFVAEVLAGGPATAAK